MTTGKQYNDKFKSHLGQGGTKAHKYCHMSGGPWCCAEVSLVYGETDKKLFYGGKYCTYCPNAIKWARAFLAELPLYMAMSGDLIFFDWNNNGVPDHIGEVDYRIDTEKIATVEGNTGSPALVRKKVRPKKYVLGIYRPLFKPAKTPTKAELKIDGEFGYNSIYNLTVALGMKPTCILTKEKVKILQKRAGASQDGAWGASTSKHLQTMLKKAGCYNGKIDSEFGPASVKALQTWINKTNYPPKKAPTTTKPATSTNTTTPTKKPSTTANKAPVKQTNTQKLLAKAKELAWAYGTAKKKYEYKTGAPKAVCKKAMKKYGWASNKAEMSDCGNFISTVVRESGVSKTFKALHGVKTPFPKTETGFITVLSGKKIPDGFLKAGDIIRYKKTNGKQHAMMYYGDGKVCEASHKNFFGVIRKDTKRYNTQSKAKTIQVLRAK